jgi:hypothetical protein
MIVPNTGFNTVNREGWSTILVIEWLLCCETVAPQDIVSSELWLYSPVSRWHSPLYWQFNSVVDWLTLYRAECRGWVFNTPASYSGGLGFTGRPVARLPWLMFLAAPSVPPGKCLVSTLVTQRPLNCTPFPNHHSLAIVHTMLLVYKLICETRNTN